MRQYIYILCYQNPPGVYKFLHTFIEAERRDEAFWRGYYKTRYLNNDWEFAFGRACSDYVVELDDV